MCFVILLFAVDLQLELPVFRVVFVLLFMRHRPPEVFFVDIAAVIIDSSSCQYGVWLSCKNSTVGWEAKASATGTAVVGVFRRAER